MTSYALRLLALLVSLALTYATKYTTTYLPSVIDGIDTDSVYLLDDRTDYPEEKTYDKSRQFYQTANVMPNLPLPLLFLNQNQKIKKSQSKKKLKESSIFYIRLPPTPYMMVPGLGFVSQPPSIQPLLGDSPTEASRPIDFQESFVSDAGYDDYLLDTREKPVKMTHKTKAKKKLTKNSKMERLNGLFYFNGRPEKIYVLPVDG